MDRCIERNLSISDLGNRIQYIDQYIAIAIDIAIIITNNTRKKHGELRGRQLKVIQQEGERGMLS